MLTNTVISERAYMGDRSLTQAFVSFDVERISDWAFAQCRNLHSVYLPKKELVFGKGVFLKDTSLKYMFALTELEMEEAYQAFLEGKVRFQNWHNEHPVQVQTAALLAATVFTPSMGYLSQPALAGNDDWIGQWDKALFDFLDTTIDLEGRGLVYSAEEDMGQKLQDYLKEERYKKLRLVYLRLHYSYQLPIENQKKLQMYLALRAYINDFTQTSDSSRNCNVTPEESGEAWELLLREYGEDKSYYQIFAEAGCVQKENLNHLLEDMGNQHVEMKSYLLEAWNAQNKETEFFEGLSL